MTAGTPSIGEPVASARLRELGQLLGQGLHQASIGSQRFTSTLSFDAVSIVRTAHVFPRRVVCGAGSYSLHFRMRSSTDEQAEELHNSWRLAFDEARRALVAEATDAGAVGVIGVEVEVQVDFDYCNVVVSGTALEPAVHDGRPLFPVQYKEPFLSDLSARDFVALTQAGWYPLALVGGAGFVNAARRDVATAVGQARQNVELANPTEALYRARQAAMGEMQDELWRSGATGVVDVKVTDRPLEEFGHIVPFMVWGTAVWQQAEHHHPDISFVLPVDDPPGRGRG